jgi:ceramide glucosyltransferase
LTGFSGVSLAVLAALILFRLAQADILARLMSADRRLLGLIPLRDLLSFGVFFAAFLGDRVEWRGRSLLVRRDGAISPA